MKKPRNLEASVGFKQGKWVVEVGGMITLAHGRWGVSSVRQGELESDRGFIEYERAAAAHPAGAGPPF